MSRTARLVVLGTSTFILCLVVFAPASLVPILLRDLGALTLTSPAGTFWRGYGDLGVAGTPLGRVAWTFSPSMLLGGQVGFDLDLSGADVQLRGRASTSFSTARADVAGTLATRVLAGVLARYDLHIPGDLTIEQLDIAAPYAARVPDVRGNLAWSGGNVAYRLSGRDHRVALPKLVGFIDSSAGGPSITVHQVDDKTPLLIGRIAQDGLATIGITKQFTQLLGEPWPGGEPDHAVVLEVGEKLF
jgi:hypothetical protein